MKFAVGSVDASNGTVATVAVVSRSNVIALVEDDVGSPSEWFWIAVLLWIITTTVFVLYESELFCVWCFEGYCMATTITYLFS